MPNTAFRMNLLALAVAMFCFQACVERFSDFELKRQGLDLVSKDSVTGGDVALDGYDAKLLDGGDLKVSTDADSAGDGATWTEAISEVAVDQDGAGKEDGGADTKPDCVAVCQGRVCGKAGDGGTCDCDQLNGGCGDDNPCTSDECDGEGQCPHGNIDKACDDADPCTDNDWCVEGACKGSLLPIDRLMAEGCLCTKKTDCDRFDDHDICTGTLDCLKNSNILVCAVDPSTVLDCRDTNPCTKDECDPVDGCSFSSVDVDCDDGNPCTVGDHCTEADCVPGASINPCDDQNECTDDTCKPEVPGGCVHTNNSLPCEDGNPCTIGDKCFNGSCVGGAEQKDCNDGNACTDDLCDPEKPGGCTYKFNKDDCEDEDPCTVGQTCLDGLCQGGSIKECGDSNVCTEESCVSGKGCAYDNIDGVCDDKNLCTKSDHCSAGKCIGTAYSCDSPGQCEKVDGAVCKGDGACSYLADPGQDCDDKNACTHTDICKVDKSCAGVPYECKAPGFCETADGATCKGDGACTYPADPGQKCDDNNACTHNDVCKADRSCGGAAYNCNGHGTCKGDGTCACSSAYSGAQCDACAKGFEVYPACDMCSKGYTNYPACDKCAGGYSGYPDCTWPFVDVEPGTFFMGSPEGCPGPAGYTGSCISEKGRFSDETLHQVTLTYKLSVMWHEVTEGEYQSVTAQNPSAFKDCDNCPVENVSWHDALYFANLLSAREGYPECFVCTGSVTNATCSLKLEYSIPQECPGYRLPTEAEWEYFARAGSTTALFNGNLEQTGYNLDPNLGQIGWYLGNSSIPRQIGQKTGNAWDIHDTSGNVSEWVWDWYGAYPIGETDPVGAPSGSYKVRRGGAYSAVPEHCRAASRKQRSAITWEGSDAGFRLVRSYPKCKPNCTNRNCGGDGCDGTCGSCAADSYCNASGVCKKKCGNGQCDFGETKCDCVADCGGPCDGKNCGEDGCGGTCGSCAADSYCNASGVCTRKCGNGQCDFGETKCTCAADCGDPCAGKTCGDNTCGGVCGTCVNGSCNASGVCTCQAHFGGAQCDSCASGIANYPACDKCSKGLTPYPACNKCAPGYEGYPNCTYTFVTVNPGKTWIGSPETESGRDTDEILHQVTLTFRLEVGRYETRQGEFSQLLGYNPSSFKACGDNCPVEKVTWHEALVFANALSAQEGYAQCFDCTGTEASSDCALKSKYSRAQDCPGYRLPTEAEWEYLARSGASSAFYDGAITNTERTPPDPNLVLIAVYGGNSGVTYSPAVDCSSWFVGSSAYCGTQASGKKAANSSGLFDMSGNVWEWVMDWYDPDYSDTGMNPVGLVTGSQKVLRGGSWMTFAKQCRSAKRFYASPTLGSSNQTGFRLVRSLVCVPNCSSRNCGDDGCGGSCGVCLTGASCNSRLGLCVHADMVSIQPGFFRMGSPPEQLGRQNSEIEHTVTITYPFEIGRYETTQKDFKDRMGYSLSSFAACGEDCPIDNVTWHEAAAFANARSINEGFWPCFDCSGQSPDFSCVLKGKYQKPQDCPGYRLPTEAEWEYAARAGSKTAFPNGEISLLGCAADPVGGVIGWYCGNATDTVHSVGKKLANSWGLFDVVGNVFEWVWDWNNEYAGDAQTDPSGPSNGSSKLFRGGSYSSGTQLCRLAMRMLSTPVSRAPGMGFRLARSLATCVPDCQGRACGYDGCGGSCGSCNGHGTCIDFTGACICNVHFDGAGCERCAPGYSNYPACAYDFVALTPGTFSMGSPLDETGRYETEVPHDVTLTFDVEVAMHETTQAEFTSLMGYNPSFFSACGKNCPVEQVSWNEAAAYANELSIRFGFAQCYTCTGTKPEFSCALKPEYSKPQDCKGGFRLPTEAEWEFAARAGTKTALPNGALTQTGKTPLDPNLGAIAWYGGNSSAKYIGGGDCSAWFVGAATCGTQTVGGKLSNPLGLFDVLGNVQEWVWDRDGVYTSSAVADPAGPGSGSFRVVRGGSWTSAGRDSRSAVRNSVAPALRFSSLGLRLARTRPCVPACTGKNCGPDGCGGDCGTCSGTGAVCLPVGNCCTPNCTGKACGDNGCGGTCGEGCAATDVCFSGACLGVKFVSIPAGSVSMGCSTGDGECLANEKPAHQISVSAFSMLETEVTEGQYQTVMNSSPSCHFGGASGANMPVECVSWTKARDFCASIGGRLPTEAEWEYAARGGKATRFACGDTIACLDDTAWWNNNSENKKHTVKGKTANDFKLFDMTGNVWEWVADWYLASYYMASPVNNPQGPVTGDARVQRGGSFDYPYVQTRLSHRSNGDPNAGAANLGFRCVKAPVCLPSCSGKVCGEDGCGGYCGSCPSGDVCKSGVCVGVKFVSIPAGMFSMGCSPADTDCTGPEGPSHNVLLSAFDLLETEVTEGQYKAVVGSNPSILSAGDTYPVEGIDWSKAKAFCEAIGGRLPTEAEWEYAARAGTTTKYPCGDAATCLDTSAWYSVNGANKKHVPKNWAKNAFGLYDMTGNMWEWVGDWYGAGYYSTSPAADPTGPDNGTFRLFRGGSFTTERGTAFYSRVSYRTGEYSGAYYNHDLGVRCARAAACVPTCSGKNCGDNGCGGFCGVCTSSQVCLPAGTCCTPSCTGKTCGSDGCGGSCGSCSGTGAVCLPAGTCCTPNCTDKVCGDDGCGGSCGTCNSHGACTNGTCGCDSGFTGTNCEKCANTGLGWAAYPDCTRFGWYDTSTNKLWQVTPSTATYTWQLAKDYCNSLSLGGLSGWHLPSISELRSIVRGCPATETGGSCGVTDSCLTLSCRDSTCGACTINEGPDGGCYWATELAGSCSDWEWSSSAPNFTVAWTVFFGRGDVFSYNVSLDRPVRCVRDAP